MDASQPNAQNTDAASLGFIVLWCFIPPSFSFRNVPLHSIDPKQRSKISLFLKIRRKVMNYFFFFFQVMNLVKSKVKSIMRIAAIKPVIISHQSFGKIARNKG